MSDSIISVENLGKKYRISHQGERQRYVALRDVIAEKAKRLFRRNSLSASNGERAGGEVSNNSQLSTLNSQASTASDHSSLVTRHSSEDFWALKDVSFEVKRGEVVGIIGRNGAGKSTLLKILSRITEPTTGRVTLRGRVASLLEVGTGFHPELTGRENVFLNGAILGMSRAEIRKKFDEIVAFAEVEKFLDTPVKRYSSGMYVRLAFAVAAHLEPEILIVDEVLTVGDAEFQKKCLGKMQDVAKGGRTVLFVSHNMVAVTRLCQRAIRLDKGAITAQGDTTLIVAGYLQTDTGDKSQYTHDPAKPSVGNDTAALLALAVKGKDGSLGPSFGSSSTLMVEISYRILKPARELRMGFHLHGADGTIIFNTTDADTEEDYERSRQPGVYTSYCIIPSGLLNRGKYSITVGSDVPMMVNFYCENIVSFFIIPDDVRSSRLDNRPGLVCPYLKWETQSGLPATL
jgi:lipopolysaccharide transport system ATP-binding protein